MLTQRSSDVTLSPNQRTTELSHNGKVALAYAKIGLLVFPCSAERKKHKPSDRLPFGKAEKRPLIGSWSKQASKDEHQIAEWWTRNPEALVALPCKQNGLLVLDADRHTAEQDGVAAFAALCEGRDEPMPAHPVVVTDYQGEHHIFRMPEEPIGNRVIGGGIETRGYRHDNDGGYVIAAGSRMPDGRGWARLKGTLSLRDALPLPPGWLVELCRPPKPQTSTTPATTQKPPGEAEEAYAMSALDRAATELARMKPSTGRDNKLMSVAGTMGRMMSAGWIGQATVEGRLFDACRANGLVDETGDAEILDKIKRGIEATTNNPHPPLPERQKGNGKDATAAEHHRQPVHDWSDPDWSLLDDRRGELPEFPMDVFSAKIQEVIKRTAMGAGVTPAHVAVPLIGIVSSLIGTARRVKATSSWLQCTTCWTVLVGFSGTGKTPAINVTKRALNQLERNSKAAEAERRRKHEAKKEIATAMRKCWEKNVKDAVKAGMPAPPMPTGADDPGKFIPLKLWVADSTIERLADLPSARPQGVLVLRDELSALFTNMSRYSRGQDNEFWLEAWNGDAVKSA
jgi:Bifunctional DNA primase/polymerase, N-terminal/Protein of unknown function (DUF3987)